MVSIDQKKLQLIKRLYYDDKKNAREIANYFNISINAVFSFMDRNNLERRTLSEQNAVRFSNKPLSFRIKDKLTQSDTKLKVAGAMLYWAEGFQSDNAHTVDFANSKPEMISLFIKFLRTICGVDNDRLRAYLYCYSNQDINGLIRFWSRLTGINKNKFSKPYIRKDFDPLKKGRMPYGLIHIRYSDKKLLRLIKEWIKKESFDLIGRLD